VGDERGRIDRADHLAGRQLLPSHQPHSTGDAIVADDHLLCGSPEPHLPAVGGDAVGQRLGENAAAADRPVDAELAVDDGRAQYRP
jgi:hypothetical protein